MNVDKLTLDELRMAIAERLGYRYYWYEFGECYLRDLGVQNTNGMTTLTGRPGDYPVNMEFVPDWPNDINEAWKLESRLDRAGQNAYILELLKPGAVGGSGERRMFDFVHATAEERCRAWLKAMEAQG